MEAPFSVDIQSLTQSVHWLFGQWVGTRRDSGVLEFCYRRISAVKQCKPLWGSQSKKFYFFEFPRVSPCDPLTKEPEDSGYEIGRYFAKTITTVTLSYRK